MAYGIVPMSSTLKIGNGSKSPNLFGKDMISITSSTVAEVKDESSEFICGG